MELTWKPIWGYEDCYAVSNIGTVVRTKTFGVKPRWKPCAPRPKRDGYVTFHLSKNGIAKDRPGHRLVWESFNGAIPNGLEINHINSLRSDNRLENLELMTRSQNVSYGFTHNGRPLFNVPHFGSKNGSARLTESDIPEIRALLSQGIAQHRIAKIYGVSQPTICQISMGNTWRHK